MLSSHDVETLLTLEGQEQVGKGKRGCVERAWFAPLGMWVAIKEPRDDAVVNTVPNEHRFLAKLHTHGIGPRVLAGNKTRVVYEYVHGIGIVEYLRGCDTSSAMQLIIAVFQQCFVLDTLGISKQEMGWPEHHVLIGTDPSAPVMIDFERCRETKRPTNVSQFSNFIHMPSIRGMLLSKGVDLDRQRFRELATAYMRGGRDVAAFEAILEALREGLPSGAQRDTGLCAK